MKVNALEYICEKISQSDDFNYKYESLIKLSSSLVFPNNTDKSNINLNINDQNKILKYCVFFLVLISLKIKTWH